MSDHHHHPYNHEDLNHYSGHHNYCCDSSPSTPSSSLGMVDHKMSDSCDNNCRSRGGGVYAQQSNSYRLETLSAYHLLYYYQQWRQRLRSLDGDIKNGIDGDDKGKAEGGDYDQYTPFEIGVEEELFQPDEGNKRSKILVHNTCNDRLNAYNY